MRLPGLQFDDYLKIYHGYSHKDVEPAPSRGYWRVKAGCPGGQDCRHAFRIAGGTCRGDTELTICYLDPEGRDARGRWLSPYRTWRAEREKLENEQAERGECVSVLQA